MTSLPVSPTPPLLVASTCPAYCRGVAAGAEVDGHRRGDAVSQEPVAVFLLVRNFGADVVNAVRPHDRADLDDVALERGFPAAGHFHIDRHFAALHLVRIVFALFDRAFDVQHIHPQQREDGVAWLDPFVLVAFDLFDDAIERRCDDTALNGELGRIELGLSW